MHPVVWLLFSSMSGSNLLLRPSGGSTCTSAAGAALLMGWLLLVLMVLLVLNNPTGALRGPRRPVGPVLEPMSGARSLGAV